MTYDTDPAGQKHAHSETEATKAFTVIDIPESELGWRNQTEAFGYILQELNTRGLYTEDELLFWGGEGSELLKTNTHGDRRETFAFTEQENATEAEKSDQGNRQFGGTALEHAHQQAIDTAVICVYRAADFEPHEETGEVRFTLKDTVQSMDDALVTVIKLT